MIRCEDCGNPIHKNVETTWSHDQPGFDHTARPPAALREKPRLRLLLGALAKDK